MAASARKPKKAANGYVLPPDKLKQREAAFTIYRDLGIGRSMHKLEQLLKKEHPELAASRSSLESWSRRHDWAARVKAHDDAIAKGRAQDVMPLPNQMVGADFDQIDALLRAANQALTRAMSASPVVTRPGDVKALVDAAANALTPIDTIKNQSSGKVSREEIAQEMTRILDEVEKARTLDVEQLTEKMVEAERTRRPSSMAAPAALGLEANQ